MIAGETRLEEYKTKYTSLADVESGTLLNIHFEDGEIISFYDIVMEKICRKKIKYLLMNLPNELILGNKEAIVACLPWMKSLKLSCNVI